MTNINFIIKYTSMSPSLKSRIEGSLKELRYHPDFADEADDALQAAIERFKEAGQPDSMKDELYSFAYDSTLMGEKYFPGRLEFLSRLITLLGERSDSKLSVAEDGCGSGVDLYVVDAILGDNVELTGVDKSKAALSRAKERVPNVTLSQNLSGNAFDVIYSDFPSIDKNMIWEIAGRGAINFNALRSPGIIVHNADTSPIGLYCRLFGSKFSKIISPELLTEVSGNHDCYLCRFEKE